MRIVPSRFVARLAVVLLIAYSGCSPSPTCSVPTANRPASLVNQLPDNPLQWCVITTQIDLRRGRMSTLYGNNPALSHARSVGDALPQINAKYALVTWRQTASPAWFGAKIPDQVESVELVECRQVEGTGPKLTYERYRGSPLRRADDLSPSQIDQRQRYVVSRKAAVMP